MFGLNSYQRAVIIIILGGIFLSTLGLGVRLMESANSLQVTFYRALGQAAFMTLILLMQYRTKSIQAFRDTGRIGFVAGFMFAGASVFLIFALNNTTVANAMFIMSLVPFAAAILAWVFLREKIERKTVIAIGVAVFGVCIMINGAISNDGLKGIVYAFIMVLFYAGFTVALRAIKNGDSLVAACWGSYLVVLLFGFGVGDLDVPKHDLILCLLLGVFQVGLGGLCLVVGSREVPAAQISLLAMLEVVLAPIWVWLGVGETPALLTLVGGGFIIAAIGYQALSRNKTNRRTA
jgi:drug/metabolite transporter (DMT)-like permease